MKKYSRILIVLAMLLSFGQQLLAFSGEPALGSDAEIQPIHQQEDESAFPSSAGYLLNGGTQSETIFHQSNRLFSGFSESKSEKEKIRDRVTEAKLINQKKDWLHQAEIIQRSLTFRELIYPHHFYF